MEPTIKLKERFCKDRNLSIKIFEEPYFTNRLVLFDKAMPDKKIMAHWTEFVEYLSTIPTEDEYFTMYNKVKDDAINYLKNNEAYIHFNTRGHSNIKYEYSQRDIYNPTNIDRYMVSVDMKKANFSALQHYDKEIFNSKDTWEDFLSMFTDVKHIINSKYIRQVIMGNCNPGGQVAYEKELMYKILKETIDKASDMNFSVLSLSSDEIIFDVSNIKDNVNQFINIIASISKTLDINVRIEPFSLKNTLTCTGYVYTRYVYDNYFNEIISKDYKCLNPLSAPAFLRNEIGEEPCDEDNVFVEGTSSRLAKFL